MYYYDMYLGNLNKPSIMISLDYRMSVLGQRKLLGCLVYLENLVKTYNIYSEEFDPGSG